ncbi:hypothetical protein CIB87_28170 [Priestia megaterium]|uniref:Uncharacterized protein n=1 Tax=Priestia megaterium TaxID=1404 RepID=A0AA86I848_PRIMG|nr:hypothetical protein [Priestia megaterium]AXI27487.1 hypothetical protein CIB87_00060 [Priestia megaterium]AXI32667.1 hypothetical protein CIB87_28170 [Priestia megaterium]
MAKIIVKKKIQSRRSLANPYSSDTLHHRLVQSGAIDLENNYVEEDLGKGYFSVKPIDKSKKLK